MKKSRPRVVFPELLHFLKSSAVKVLRRTVEISNNEWTGSSGNHITIVLYAVVELPTANV
jgi:hypothetical protein